MKIGYLAFLLTSMSIATSILANALVDSLISPVALSSGSASDCHNPGVSANGRFVVFVSTADNLVTNDNNGAFDIFVRDRLLSKTVLVSVNATGTKSGNGASHSPTISSNGQFVVFESTSSDLVPNDTNNASDIFLRDLVAGTTTLVSVDTNGVGPGNLDSSAPDMTPDGRYVLFASQSSNLAANDLNNAVDLFVRDTSSATTLLVTRKSDNTSSFAGTSVVWAGNRQISDDGRWVTFQSLAANLVAGDLNAKLDVFIRDLQSSSNLAVSVSAGGTLGNGDSQNPSADSTGRYVAFQSAASNLTTNDLNTELDIFLRDNLLGTTTLVSVNATGVNSASGSGSPVLSRQGSVVVFSSSSNNLVQYDTNSSGADLFRRDLTTGTTTLIAYRVAQVNSAGPILNFVPVLSSDGRFLLYQDSAKNLMLFDAVAGTNTTVTTNTPVTDATMTDNGLWIAFIGAPEANGTRNIYLFDRLSGITELISVREPSLNVNTGAASSRLTSGGVSSNGQFIVLESYASDLSSGDTNRDSDVMIGDLNAGSNSWIRLNTILNGFSRGPSRRPVISSDGRWVAFEAIPDSTPLAGLGTRFNLYTFDRLAQTNVLIAGVGKVSAPSLPVFSQQGNFLAFQSSETGVGGYATTVGQIYYRDMAQETNRLVSRNYQGTAAGSYASYNAAISLDGRYVTYLGSGNSALVTNLNASSTSAFLWDSVSSSNFFVGGSSGPNSITRDPTFAANDTLIALERRTNTLLFDVASKSSLTTLTDAVNVVLSPNGRFVACERSKSYSVLDTNLTTDVYLIDRTNGQASLVSVNQNGTGAGNDRSLSPLLTPDGRYVIFRSRASNLVANDTNGLSDVFLRDLVLNRTILLSINRGGSGTGNRFSGNPVISMDGSTVLFETYATDLTTGGDYNDSRDVMVLRLSRSDSDHDGLPDDWELAYFNGLQRDGTSDYDEDGLTDAAEFQAGTDPTNAGSILRVITLSSPQSGPVQIFWSAVSGKTYRVQFKATVSDPTWTNLDGDVTATDESGYKVDPLAGATEQRYYRILVVP